MSKPSDVSNDVLTDAGKINVLPSSHTFDLSDYVIKIGFSGCRSNGSRLLLLDG